MSRRLAATRFDDAGPVRRRRCVTTNRRTSKKLVRLLRLGSQELRVVGAAIRGHGHGWFRTSDLSRVKQGAALSAKRSDRPS